MTPTGITRADTWMFRGSEQTGASIIGQLWSEYIGARRPGMKFSQQIDVLQESVRKCMRDEQDSYLRGAATAERVKETQGHAVLIGKIKAQYQREGIDF